MPTNFLSVYDHFVGLTLKWLILSKFNVFSYNEIHKTKSEAGSLRKPFSYEKSFARVVRKSHSIYE